MILADLFFFFLQIVSTEVLTDCPERSHIFEKVKVFKKMLKCFRLILILLFGDFDRVNTFKDLWKKIFSKSKIY